MFSFKELMARPVEEGEDEYLKYRAQKRRRGLLGGTIGGPVSESVELDEALSTAARLKKGRNMKRYASRMAMGRKKALKKTAGRAKIKQRAERQARNAMFKKLTKGIPRSDLTPARRAEIEKRMDKMKGRIQKQAVKLMPVVRKMEKDRKSRR